MEERPTLSEDMFPCDIAAEMATLSAILIDPSFAFSQVSHILNEMDFYKESHQFIYRALFTLSESGSPIDSISLGNKLAEMGKLEFAGGYAYLSELISYAPTAQNVEYYARLILGKSQLRQLIRVTNDIQARAKTPGIQPHDLLDEAEQKILDIAKQREVGAFDSIRNLATHTLNELEKQMKNKELSGVASGFKALDSLTNGFQKSDLIILAARPSMGKTAFALNIAANIGIPRGNEEISPAQTVLIFSLEMSEQQLTRRFLASEARVDSSKIQSGYIQTTDWKKFINSMDRIRRSQIYISEAAGLSYLDMKTIARRVQAKYGLGIIIVDYLQLVMLPSRRSNSDNRQNEVAEVSRNLKQMARELDVPVLALSQLSRDVEKRNTKKPMLSDLRDSGAIEQDADIVAFIHRPEYYDKEDPTKKGLAEIIISKHRNGAIGELKLSFIEQYTRFETYVAEEEY